MFVAILGTFLHSAYSLSGYNPFVAFFVPTNESVFEHLKLLFFPQFLYTTLEYFFTGRKYRNFIFTKALSCVIGLLIIPIVFYTYTVFTGGAILWVDILLFYIAVFCAFLSSYRMLSKKKFYVYDWNAYGVFLYSFGMLLFFLCTVYPPDFILFQVP